MAELVLNRDGGARGRAVVMMNISSRTQTQTRVGGRHLCDDGARDLLVNLGAVVQKCVRLKSSEGPLLEVTSATPSPSALSDTTKRQFFFQNVGT